MTDPTLKLLTRALALSNKLLKDPTIPEELRLDLATWRQDTEAYFDAEEDNP